MSQDSDPAVPATDSVSPPRQKESPALSGEDFFLMFMVLVGLGGGAWFTTRELPAVVPSLFLAIAVASLTYRFLGGLGEEAEVALSKALPVDVKLTGSIAALIGSGVLIYLAMSRDQQPQPPAFEPPVKEWLAFDRRNFTPRKVSIRQPGAEEPVEVNKDFRLDPLWFRMDREGGVYPEAAAAMDGPGFYLGKVRPEDLPARVSGVELEGAALSFNLPPFSPPYELPDLDVKLATCRYSHAEHQFKLCAADCPPCEDEGEHSLAKGKSDLVAVDGKSFLVTAIESNLQEDEVVLQRISFYPVDQLIDDNLVDRLRDISLMIPIPPSARVSKGRTVGTDREWDLSDLQGSWRVTVRTEGSGLLILWKYYARFLVAELGLATSS